METISTNTENSKTSEPHILNLSQGLDLKVRINMLFFRIYIFITHGEIYDNSINTKKISLNYKMVLIMCQDYFEYIIKT